MTEEQARQLIALLEQAQRRPGMFFPLNRDGLSGFLAGIHVAQLAFFGPLEPSSITDDILRERGWQTNPTSLWPDMEARHYDFHTAMYEVLTIEIETLRRLYNIVASSE